MRPLFADPPPGPSSPALAGLPNLRTLFMIYPAPMPLISSPMECSTPPKDHKGYIKTALHLGYLVEALQWFLRHEARTDTWSCMKLCLGWLWLHDSTSWPRTKPLSPSTDTCFLLIYLFWNIQAERFVRYENFELSAWNIGSTTQESFWHYVLSSWRSLNHWAQDESVNVKCLCFSNL